VTEKEPTRSAWSYPKTSITLLRTLRETRSGVDDAAWARFVDMYGPVVHHLVRLLSPGISDADTDGAVQDFSPVLGLPSRMSRASSASLPTR